MGNGKEYPKGKFNMIKSPFHTAATSATGVFSLAFPLESCILDSKF